MSKYLLFFLIFVVLIFKFDCFLINIEFKLVKNSTQNSELNELLENFTKLNKTTENVLNENSTKESFLFWNKFIDLENLNFTNQTKEDKILNQLIELSPFKDLIESVKKKSTTTATTTTTTSTTFTTASTSVHTTTRSIAKTTISTYNPITNRFTRNTTLTTFSTKNPLPTTLTSAFISSFHFNTTLNSTLKSTTEKNSWNSTQTTTATTKTTITTTATKQINTTSLNTTTSAFFNTTTKYTNKIYNTTNATSENTLTLPKTTNLNINKSSTATIIYTTNKNSTILTTITKLTTLKTPVRNTTTTSTTITTRRLTTQTPLLTSTQYENCTTNLCLNFGECYLDYLLEPACKCLDYRLVYYDLVIEYYSGKYCENITYSLTFIGLTSGLASIGLIFFTLILTCTTIWKCLFAKRDDDLEAEKPIISTNGGRSSTTEFKNESFEPDFEKKEPNEFNTPKKKIKKNSWKYIKMNFNLRKKGRKHGKKHQIYIKNKIKYNGSTTIQKYLDKHARNLFKSMEGLMNLEQQNVSEDENFIIVKRKLNTSLPNVNAPSAPTLSKDSFSLSLKDLNELCSSNVSVYPRPNRNTGQNSFNGNDNEVAFVNGSLFY